MKDTECAAVRKEFGAQLKALRKARRLTAAELGLRTDIHEKDVYRYESGAQYPSWERWCRLYKDFGGAAFPSYRPIAAGVKLLPVTDAVLDELDELTKTFSIEEIRRGCCMPIGGNLYNIMHGKYKCVHRRTLQNIFDFLGWGEISDEKMGGYTVPLSGTEKKGGGSLKEYKVGGWRAVLLSVRVINSYRRGTMCHLKSREFAVRKVSDPRLFCTVSVPDRDGSHEDTELLQVLAALDAYRGEDESMSVIANEGCMTRSAPAN